MDLRHWQRDKDAIEQETEEVFLCQGKGEVETMELYKAGCVHGECRSTNYLLIAAF